MKRIRILTQERLERIVQEEIDKRCQNVQRDYEQELLMKQVNIRILQSQINPHFLYNALECIRGKAIADNATDIADIAQAMARFFRYSISNKGDFVTLSDEIDSINNYMKIQRFRFPGRFEYEVTFEEGNRRALDASLPKLTLQPVVENAIVHGLSDKTSGAKIQIRISSTDRHVNLIVSDNGRGMTAEELRRLNQRINRRDESENQQDADGSDHIGIGMHNVHRRIQLCFGDEYGMSVNSCEDIGTDVELFFPYRVRM